jgi:hypothetical protein
VLALCLEVSCLLFGGFKTERETEEMFSRVRESGRVSVRVGKATGGKRKEKKFEAVTEGCRLEGDLIAGCAANRRELSPAEEAHAAAHRETQQKAKSAQEIQFVLQIVEESSFSLSLFLLVSNQVDAKDGIVKS